MATPEQVKYSVSQFSSKMYQFMAQSQTDAPINTFVSPFSVYASMAMVLQGTGGNTKSQMLSTLQMPNHFGSTEAHHIIGPSLASYFESSDTVKLNSANGLFIESYRNVKPQFEKDIKTHYKAHVQQLPFATDPQTSKEQINDWVANETMNKIPKFLTPYCVGEDTAFIVANALYFRGLWSTQFDEEFTMDSAFHKLDGSRMTVKMMYVRAAVESAALPQFNAKLVRLPFMNSHWEMVIVLPDTLDGLKNLLQKMSVADTLGPILSTPCDVCPSDIYLPKFKLGEGEPISISIILESMGMEDLFSPVTADLSGITDCRLYASDVLHKAILEVDEQGAAAATGCLINLKCKTSYPKICIDHPFFVALVYDKTVPIFLGHVTNPE